MEDIIRPFIPYDAFAVLQAIVNKNTRVFEYGSGMSTLWFAQNAGEVITVENDEKWFANILGKLEKHDCKNVTYIRQSDCDKYSQLIHKYDGTFDLVFVDGRFRKECMEECFFKARSYIFLDNSDADHYQDAYDVMRTYKPGDLEDYCSYGLNPYTGEDLPDKWQASMFIKEK